MRSILVSLALLAIAAPVRAQDAPGVLQGIVAMTSTNDRNPSFGVALGGRAGWMEITGEGGRMQNVVPKDLQNIVRQMQQAAGINDPLATVRVPAYYGLVSLKVVPSRGVIRPFVTAGGGLARLNPELRSGAVQVTLPGVFPPRKSTKALLAAGAGLRFGFGRNLAIDGGYRYSRIYSDYRVDTNLGNDAILTNIGTWYAAFGIRF